MGNYPENTKFGYAGQGEKRPAPLNHLIQNRNEAVVSSQLHQQVAITVYLFMCGIKE
jgi:hypothetical protein